METGTFVYLFPFDAKLHCGRFSLRTLIKTQRSSMTFNNFVPRFLLAPTN